MINLELKCPAKSNFIEFADKIIKDCMEKVNFKELDKMSFAAHEIIINSIDAVKSKFGINNNEFIVIKIDCNENKTEIIIKDRAGGIEENTLNNLDEISFEDLLFDESGRGLLFVKNLVDEFNYHINEKQESVFTLRKEVK